MAQTRAAERRRGPGRTQAPRLSASRAAPHGDRSLHAQGRGREPEPPLAVVRAASPRTELPSLATPCLADATADEVDASALRHILAARISQLSAVKERKRKEEEKAKELTDSAYSMLEKAGVRRKRKEKRMKRFPRGSSLPPPLPRALRLWQPCFACQRIHVYASESEVFTLFALGFWTLFCEPLSVRSLGRLRSTSIWMFLRVTSGSISVFCPACFDSGYM